MSNTESEPSLIYAPQAPAIWNALGGIKRRGWVNAGIKNPETVAEHTTALLKLAHALYPILQNEIDAKQFRELLAMLEVHDWPEVIVGDQIVLVDRKHPLALEKRKNEHEAMQKLCGDLDETIGKEVFAIWERYEDGKDAVAALAHQIDKYQAVEKAFEYEKSGEATLTKEFIAYSRKYISHPVLVQKLKEIENEVG